MNFKILKEIIIYVNNFQKKKKIIYLNNALK